MKRVLIGLAIALSAASSQASYLFWQVTGNEGWWRGGTLSAALPNDGSPYTITSIRVREVSSSGDTILSSYETASSTPLDNINNYFTSENVYAQTTTPISAEAMSAYSYYIEIMGYGGAYGGSAESTVRLAESTHRTYAELSGSSITTSLSDMASIPSAWTGEAYAAPEPTSGLLLLVGASLLALKRRKV
ncbi:MAG: PEP-CTERM sorting domain-containing protein [Kiritimatiellae bacterium]|nr:PEP-CTERM sorting domain-containing protein [Kiritimatiellia bacterium]